MSYLTGTVGRTITFISSFLTVLDPSSVPVLYHRPDECGSGKVHLLVCRENSQLVYSFVFKFICQNFHIVSGSLLNFDFNDDCQY